MLGKFVVHVPKLFIMVLMVSFVGCEKDPLPIYNTAETDYSFFIAGHVYGEKGANNMGVYPPFKEKFDLIRNDQYIQFGVFTGDIVQDPSVEDWDEIDDDVSELNMPIHFSVGNHDMIDRALYDERYGVTYKSFTYNSDLYIMLDPNINKLNISGDQLTFLKTTLSTDHKNADNIFVFFHQLLWWRDDNKYKNVDLNYIHYGANFNNFWSEVEPLFTELPNQVYMFAGDVGAKEDNDAYMYHKYDNITLIASGMGGGTEDNFVIVDVKEDKTVDFRIIALNGDNIHTLEKLQDYKLN